MASIPAMRTYTFKSAEAALSFSTHYKSLAASLKQNHNVDPVGVYISKTKPTQTIAIVEYPAGSDPQIVMHDFAQSDAFKKDLEGFDVSQLENIEEMILEKVEF